MYPVWLHFRPQMGPQNRSKIDHSLDLFLNDFWEPLFHAFDLHLGSQNTSKKRPKSEPTPNHKIHWFCCYLLHLSHFWGSWKSSLLSLCWTLFLNIFSIPLFHRCCTLLITLLGPHWHPARPKMSPQIAQVAHHFNWFWALMGTIFTDFGCPWSHLGRV